MKQNKMTTAAMIVIVLAGLSSCKKDDKKDEPKKLTCNLISANINSNKPDASSYTFSYNSDNKVSQIVYVYKSTTTTTTLAYSGNTVNATSREGGALKGKAILTLNSAGRIVRQENRDIVNDTIQAVLIYTYSASGELTTFSSQSGKTEPKVSTVASINGNVSSIASAGNVTLLEYYTDQASRAGDYIDILQRLQLGNNFYIVNKNLVKSQTTGTDISNFSYTYDANNNISALQIVNNGTTTDVTYQHQCQ